VAKNIRKKINEVKALTEKSPMGTNQLGIGIPREHQTGVIASPDEVKEFFTVMMRAPINDLTRLRAAEDLAKCHGMFTENDKGANDVLATMAVEIVRALSREKNGNSQ
jgi:hypothetical protein